MIVRPHAKVNLQLRITGRREDGYHTLDTVFLPVSLYDVLEAEEAEAFSFSCSDPALEGPGNLVLRAYARMKERFDLPPVRIRLTKQIPSQAGLGGGSADAAGMLLLLNEMFSLGCSREDLAQIAVPLGADVPAMLCDQPMHGLGTGEILTPVPCRTVLPLLIVKPPVGFSTPAMFRAWDKTHAGREPGGGEQEMQALIRALSAGDLPGIAAGLRNDLEKALSAEEAALIGSIKEELLRAGALGACMSGSGSAVFGLFDNVAPRDAAAEMLRNTYREDFISACEGLCDE